VAEQEVIGLEWVGGEEKMADGGSGEVVGFFERGGASATAFGGAVADQQAGDVAAKKRLVEVSEQVGEAFVGPAVVA
jgi:hypothetical protein